MQVLNFYLVATELVPGLINITLARGSKLTSLGLANYQIILALRLDITVTEASYTHTRISQKLKIEGRGSFSSLGNLLQTVMVIMVLVHDSFAILLQVIHHYLCSLPGGA